MVLITPKFYLNFSVTVIVLWWHFYRVPPYFRQNILDDLARRVPDGSW